MNTLRWMLAGPLLLALMGCAATSRHALGPPPEPLLSTRDPSLTRPLPPQPAPPRLPPPVVRPPARRLPAVTLVVDAGHGGKDPGARGVGPLKEKQVNLGVARELVHELTHRGAHVITTRSGDRFVELDERAAIADRTNADLFISIHADASQRAAVTGATIYIARDARRESRAAAEHIGAALRRAGIEFRGIQRAGFRVLVGHGRPAVLIECGFLTNSREAWLLSTAEYQERLARAIADGVTRHFGD